MFERDCPYYLSIGMTYDQYWYGDVRMVKAFREADKQRQQREDCLAWQQGMYFYEAVSKAIHNAFRGKNERPEQYTDQPYSLKHKETQQFDDGMTPEEREILIAKITLDNERRRRNGTL